VNTTLKRPESTRAVLALLAGLACALPACGGDPPPAIPPTVLVAITPSTVALAPGGTRQFTAAVTGTDNTAVTFSVTESNGGSITASGFYTAPAAAGSFHVVATSAADPTKKSTAVVVVVPPGVTLTLSPTSASVQVGATQQFTAAVTGSANTAVTYAVTEAAGGAITAGGLYSAPSATGTFHVVATSVADTSKTATAVVTVTSTAVVAITLSPTTAALQVGATQQFTATVTGSANTVATYAVTEAGGGTITTGGLYTAPAVAGTFHVVATSAADGSKTASAVVTVTTAPVVSIAIAPATASVPTGATQQFTATVTGSANTAVTYAVTEAGGGTVTAGGLYTAPGATGTFHVVATSAADTSKKSTATVTVTASPATTLAWTDPASGTYQLKKNAGLSTATHLVLDLTGVGAPSGTGIAFTLSADAAFATWAKVAAADTELIQNGAVIVLGTGVQAFRGKATGALLQGVTAKKGLGGAVSLNGVLARVALDLKAGAAKGAVTLSATKAQVLLADGSLSPVTITAGTLAAQ
jgi:hypothetical protein